MTNLNFEELALSQEVRKAVLEMGFEQCTPIQAQAIPVLLEGKDVIGQAQTGTGKTVAFGIPIVEKLDARDRHVQSLILCPTRELAIQVSEEIRKLIRFKPGVQIVPIYGGQPIERQIRALRQGVHVVIGTPGRVIDHIERRSLDLSQTKTIVLDEADEMLDMGFREDIESILKSIPETRQTVFFSATMAKPILALTKEYQTNPVHIAVLHKELTVSNIDQKYLDLPERSKMEGLSRLIDLHDPKLSLVFCNTKRKVNDVVSELQARGYFADGLHGDLKQSERNAVMDKFRKGIVDILVATDVAARGIDVDDVEVVFNYDVPLDEESYVHRIGRTGRAGKSGKAFTFVAGREMYQLRDIERYTKSKILVQKMPTVNEVEEKKMGQMLDRVKSMIEEGHLAKQIDLVEKMMGDHYSSVEVAAALLKLLMGDNEKAADGKPQPSQGSAEDQGAEPGMVRLFINLGRNQRIQPKDIVGAIANEAGIAGKSIGLIDIYENFTFVEVPQGDAPKVLEVMQNSQIKGKAIRIQVARRK
jgi:ATP-dependent RNA helicase DeaD